MLKPEWMRDCEPGGGATNPLPPRAARTLSVHVHSAYVQQHGNFACFKDDVYLQVRFRPWARQDAWAAPRAAPYSFAPAGAERPSRQPLSTLQPTKSAPAQ